MKMKGKLLMGVLAIMILAGIAGCICLKVATGTEKLKTVADKEIKQEVDEQKKEAVVITESITDFSVGESASSAEKKAEKADDKKADKETGKKKKSKKDKKKAKDYICKDSSSRELNEEDLEEIKNGDYGELPNGKSPVRMAVNEMYAKYGYQFSNEEIQKYFEAKEWYQKITDRNTNMDQIYDGMTQIEKNNVDFLSDNDN